MRNVPRTAKRSVLAGWAEYGYCASHSRYFWGLRLHLVCTLHGLPIGWALTGAKADERDVLIEILTATPALTWSSQPWAIMIGGQELLRQSFEADLDAGGIDLLRPSRKGEQPDLVNGSSNHCGRSSNRSTTPSKANSTSSTTAAAPSPGSAPASPNASWP